MIDLHADVRGGRARTECPTMPHDIVKCTDRITEGQVTGPYRFGRNSRYTYVMVTWRRATSGACTGTHATERMRVGMNRILRYPTLLLASTNPLSGKTAFAVGIGRALQEQGYAVGYC